MKNNSLELRNIYPKCAWAKAEDAMDQGDIVRGGGCSVRACSFIVRTSDVHCAKTTGECAAEAVILRSAGQAVEQDASGQLAS